MTVQGRLRDALAPTVSPATRTAALAALSAAWDTYEATRTPWWLEPLYSWVSRWQVPAR